MKTMKSIYEALAQNLAAAAKLHEKLDAEINAANKDLGAGKASPEPDTLEEIIDLAGQLDPVTQWAEALRVSKEYAEKLGRELTDEDAIVALTKARKYTTYRVQVNKTTSRYEKVSKQVKFDMLGMLAKLGVDLTAFKQKMSVVLCSIALLADKRVNKGKNKDAIIAQYKSDDDIKKALKEEKSIGSLGYLQGCVQNAVNAYLPSADYKANDEAAEYFYAISTKIDKKKVCGVSAGVVKEAYEGFFDYANQLLLKDGKVRYNIAYKDHAPLVREYVTAEDKTEGNTPSGDEIMRAEGVPDELREQANAAGKVIVTEETYREFKELKKEEAAAKEAPKSRKGKSGKSKAA